MPIQILALNDYINYFHYRNKKVYYRNDDIEDMKKAWVKIKKYVASVKIYERNKIDFSKYLFTD